MENLIIGTRNSPLALWQTHWVKQLLEERGYRVVLKEIKTSGDKIQKGPLAAHGGKGLFVKELESALLSGEVHLAVHSLKDVPTVLAEDFTLAAFLPRADPRDCLVSRHGGSLEDLPMGARFGSSSPRRVSQLLNRNPTIRIENLRGNVGTRLSKIEGGDFDGTFLAKAGLDRLEVKANGLLHPLDPEVMTPAAGQGIVAIETLGASEQVNEIIGLLNDPEASSAARTERALVKNLEGSCTSPIGAYARIEGGEIHLRCFVGDLKGVRVLRECSTGSVGNEVSIGEEMAEGLNRLGAREILESCEEP
ncbi:MAG: hydroxymethylbilane synthase [Candidatus Omnitrophica bacterium]|nr:hydroxymethylbilane synthase [Candidatus Omnitrophota bacterium]MCB9768215.1 hydroxymethylbilane synthase [Candidatus Omnitrophota bacterium]